MPAGRERTEASSTSELPGANAGFPGLEPSEARSATESNWAQPSSPVVVNLTAIVTVSFNRRAGLRPRSGPAWWAILDLNQ